VGWGVGWDRWGCGGGCVGRVCGGGRGGGSGGGGGGGVKRGWWGGGGGGWGVWGVDGGRAYLGKGEAGSAFRAAGQEFTWLDYLTRSRASGQAIAAARW